MNDAAPLPLRHIRERHLQIAKAYAPKTAMQEIDQLTEKYPAGTRQRSRHETEQLHHDQDWQIFDSVTHFLESVTRRLPLNCRSERHADGNIL
jgi:hypothetical protein